ncbi:hypothetical protein [Ralstonia insidiosa]|uniref:Lipoprotein n=1 Tax=Ralstonia insidiosa TaxID=190721 RepID=A0A848P883_9RALS|nr:hypothetical protein [Ralstonia insidiosa]NMV41960.1 hypothetical protein [Ralstonia insidiosa]
MIHTIRGALSLPLTALVITLAACGGGENDSTTATPVELSGWFICNGPFNYVAVTPRNNLYGTCDGKNLFSASYTAQLDQEAQKTAPGWLNAVLSNVFFYDIDTGLPPTSPMARGSVPQDTYTGAGQTHAGYTTLDLGETGGVSKAGALSNGSIIPARMNLQGRPYCSPSCSATAPNPPATAGGYAGTYGVIVPVPYAIAGNSTTWTWQSDVNLTIDAAGSLSGTLPQGTLKATIVGFDASQGIAEYTGTLATASGAVAVQGVFGYDPTGTDARVSPMVALYVSGSPFEFLYHLSKR